MPTGDSTPDPSPHLSEQIAREVGALYLAAERGLARRQRTVGRPLEKLSLHVLGRLLDSGPMRPSALAQLVRLDLSTVSRHVAALEAGGLAVRESDPHDRRASLIRLTPAGAQAATALRARGRERMSRILAGWSDADRADLARLLARLNQAVARLDEENPDTGPPTTAPPTTAPPTTDGTTA